MKKNYLQFFLCLLFTVHVNAQKTKANDVLANLGDVSVNVSSAIKAYNLEDLKHHVKASKIAINNVIRETKAIECNDAMKFSNKISTFLETAFLSDELATARYYLSETEVLINNAFYEYESCTVVESGNEALANLEQQQSNLRLQQIALEQRAKEIKQKLIEQKEKEVELEKEQFIALNEKAILKNVNSFNDVLKNCGCNTTIKNSNENIDLKAKDMQQIKVYYLDKITRISESYLTQLRSCKDLKR